MLVICYQQLSSTFAPNNTTTLCYTTTDLSIEDWQANNPNTIIDMVFNSEDDIKNQQTYQYEQFEKYCYRFGFEPTDYNAELNDNHNHKCLFIGFLPNNRKYTCRIYDTETNQYYKVSPKYIKCRMEKYKEK